jgi:hypothetical protein
LGGFGDSRWDRCLVLVLVLGPVGGIPDPDWLVMVSGVLDDGSLNEKRCKKDGLDGANGWIPRLQMGVGIAASGRREERA